jgi:hypothetical protein
MADNERSNLHDDAYQTDSYLRTGPLGVQPRTVSESHMGVCGSVTFDARGRIVTVCVGVAAVTLRLLDPVTLRSLASYELPPRPVTTGNPFQNFTGGGYFYLDDRDRAVVPTSDRRILVIPLLSGSAFGLDRAYDVSSAVAQGDGIVSALPDWSGRIWFVTRSGVVGTVDPASGRVRSKKTGEPIGNSFAVGEDGGVYIVTDGGMYRFDAAEDGSPRVTWGHGYDNDRTQKPGQSQAGSGTTPTLMGADLVAITDNADPIDVVVYRRAPHITGPREVCRHAVFAKGASSTDQSLLTDGRSLVVENNYGYTGPHTVALGQTTQPGIARIDVDRRARRCTLRWTSQERPPSVVPKLALGSGLVYTYVKDPRADLSDPWYLAALDWRNGSTVFRALVGAGPLFNNNYAPVTIGPDGTAYVGVLGGLAAVHDASPPRVESAPALGVTTAKIRLSCRRGRLTARASGRGLESLTLRTADRHQVADERPPLSVAVRHAGRRVTLTVTDEVGGEITRRRLVPRPCRS